MTPPAVPVSGERTRGVWPVREHLRPRPSGSDLRGWCPLFNRRPAPSEGPDWRNYNCTGYLPIEVATVLPIGGEA
ncbi:MAG: hypothetical protein ABSC06_34755 [Rhodopila sp.]|jgi:hypothetical protein